MYCKNCGTKLENGINFCPICGTKIDEVVERIIEVPIEDEVAKVAIHNNVILRSATKECNKWVSFFLCLFFGYLGAHKFYEGHAGKGILYFFTLGLCGFGWFIDTISILCKPTYYYTVRG